MKGYFPSFLTAGGTECVFIVLRTEHGNSHLSTVWPLMSPEAISDGDAVFCHEV